MATPETNSPAKIEKPPEAPQKVVKTLLDLITQLIGDSDYDAMAFQRLADESIIVTESANDISTKEELSAPESLQPLVSITIDRTAYSDHPTPEGKLYYEVVTTPDGKLKIIVPEPMPPEQPELAEDLLGLSQDERIEVLEQNLQRRTKQKLEAPGLSQREAEDLILDLAASEPDTFAKESA